MLAEFCDFTNNEELIKYKFFLAASSEQFFTAKLSDLDYHGCTVGDLLAILSNLEAAYKEQKVEIVHNVKRDKCMICGKGNYTDKDCCLKNVSFLSVGSLVI